MGDMADHAREQEEYQAWDLLERGFSEAAAESDAAREVLIHIFDPPGSMPSMEESNMHHHEKMRIKVSWFDAPTQTRQSETIEVPGYVTPQSVKCDVSRPVRIEPVDDFDVVRCVFPTDPTRREYCYRDGGVKPGEWAIVHSPRTNRPETVRVVGYGRNAYTGPIFKVAAPAPSQSDLRT